MLRGHVSGRSSGCPVRKWNLPPTTCSSVVVCLAACERMSLARFHPLDDPSWSTLWCWCRTHSETLRFRRPAWLLISHFLCIAAVALSPRHPSGGEGGSAKLKRWVSLRALLDRVIKDWPKRRGPCRSGSSKTAWALFRPQGRAAAALARVAGQGGEDRGGQNEEGRRAKLAPPTQHTKQVELQIHSRPCRQLTSAPSIGLTPAAWRSSFNGRGRWAVDVGGDGAGEESWDRGNEGTVTHLEWRGQWQKAENPDGVASATNSMWHSATPPLSSRP